MEKLTVINEDFYKSIKQSFVKQTDEKKFKKEINFAIQILKKSSYLQKCDANSVLDSVMNISQTGLSLNPILAYAYLVPMKRKCVLMPGYQGLIKLVTDAGSVNSIEVQLIYEGDDVLIDMASPEKIQKHIPYILTDREKGNILGGYSLANLSDGNKHVEIMSRADIEEIRDCSESYKYAEEKKSNNSPWHTHEAEMFRKTVVRRHFKYLPKTENVQLERAIELDNADYDFPATMGQGNYIESLLITASIDEKTSAQIYNSIGDLTQSRAEECIAYLQENQLDPIKSGSGYNQGDIQKKLNELKQ
jgi:phage RecT family recombinase